MLGIKFNEEQPVDTIISAGTKLNGVLDTDESIRIDGSYDGTINCRETLIIGPSADIEADIITDVAIIGGKVSGNITAHSKIEIRNSGEIFGDLTAPVLQIERGVILEGSCTINTGSNSSEEKVTSIKDKLG
ncbi:MAG: polymer-forming cytoskeletal protein [bacterium]